MSIQEQSRRDISELHLPLSFQQRQGRALNAVATLFRNTLRVPQIYLKIGWPKLDRKRVDLMAVDRAGAGDVHVVFVDLDSKTISSHSMLNTIKKYPAHFMYLAALYPVSELIGDYAAFFSKDGIGRVGIIQIDEQDGPAPTATLIQKPERFRMSEESMRSVGRFTFKNTPDIEIKI